MNSLEKQNKKKTKLPLAFFVCNKKNKAIDYKQILTNIIEDRIKEYLN